MQNIAHRLALLSVIGGLILLMIAPQGHARETLLGTALIVMALLLVGLGKSIDLLGHVRAGATDQEDEP